MFKTKQAPALLASPSGPRLARAAVPTIISADMVVHGNLKTDGDVQVEGQVYGDIEAGRLVIAETGMVSGNVIADNARICGTLTGCINGASVTLTATARVTGDIQHDVLAIEAGGLLEGHSRRRTAKLAEIPASVAPPAPVLEQV